MGLKFEWQGPIFRNQLLKFFMVLEQIFNLKQILLFLTVLHQTP